MSSKLVKRQLRELGGDISLAGVDFGQKKKGGPSSKKKQQKLKGGGAGLFVLAKGGGGGGAGGKGLGQGAIKKKGKSRREKKPAFPEMAAVKRVETKEERAQRRAEQLTSAARKIKEDTKAKGSGPNSLKVLMYRGHGVKQVEDKDGSDSDDDDSDLDDIMAGL